MNISHSERRNFHESNRQVSWRVDDDFPYQNGGFQDHEIDA